MNDNEKIKDETQDTQYHLFEEEHEDETIKHAHDALQLCKAEVEEWKNKYFLMSADFQNYKRRLVTEKADWNYEAQRAILLDTVAIVDDFERAFEQEKKQAADKAGTTSLLTGFSLIYQSLEKMLKKYDVTSISQLTTFDPQYHEALMHVESPEHTSGEIVHVMQKGYLFKDKVLRPAQVSVAK